MSKKLDPRRFPDYTRQKVIDRHMEALDTHGISRRDFLSFASASAIAAATAGSLGFPGVARGRSSSSRFWSARTAARSRS